MGQSRTANRWPRRWGTAIAVLGMWWLAAGVNAQPQAPADRYPDDDPAAQLSAAPDPRDRDAVREVDRALRRDAGNVAARVQKGLSYYAINQPSRGSNEFEQAIAAAEPGSVLSRFARWNYGWALFESADPTGALAQWQVAAREHGGQPYWLPVVTALVLWMQGDREGAQAYYAAAVRSDPARWETADGLRTAIADWPPNARFTLESVQQAWQASR